MGESPFLTDPPIFQVPAVIFFGGGGVGLSTVPTAYLDLLCFFPVMFGKLSTMKSFTRFLGVKKSFRSRRIRKFELCKGFDTGE